MLLWQGPKGIGERERVRSFPWKMCKEKKKVYKMLIYTRHDVIFAMIYSPMWVNRVACIAQKCETLIARKYPFNETSEMIYVADDVLFTTAATPNRLWVYT
jgi:hypothetical protein